MCSLSLLFFFCHEILQLRVMTTLSKAYTEQLSNVDNRLNLSWRYHTTRVPSSRSELMRCKHGRGQWRLQWSAWTHVRYRRLITIITLVTFKVITRIPTVRFATKANARYSAITLFDVDAPLSAARTLFLSARNRRARFIVKKRVGSREPRSWGVFRFRNCRFKRWDSQYRSPRAKTAATRTGFS